MSEQIFRTYYTNPNGSRWIHVDQFGKKEKINILTPDGKKEKRTVIFYEAFGNFASATISWKGKRISVLPDTDENGERYVDIQKWLDLKKKYEEEKGEKKEKLNLCKCGAEPKLIVKRNVKEGKELYKILYTVECPKCGRHQYSLFISEHQAIEQWNGYHAARS